MIDIELAYTKPKLTEKLFKQLPKASLDAMRDGKLIGFVRRKYGCFLLFQYEHALYLRFAGLSRPADIRTRVAVIRGRGTTCRIMTDTQDPEEWWQVYEKCVKDAQQIFY